MTITRNSATVLALVLGFSVLLAGGRAAALQDAPPTITEIAVKGNKNINSEAIIASAGLKVGDAVTAASLDAARTKVLAMGVFGASADTLEEAVKVTAAVTGSSAAVTIEVLENDIVKSINISGTAHIPAAEIAALLQTKQGSVLDMNVLRADTERIRKYYEDRKYVMTWSDEFGFRDGTLYLPIVVARVGKVRVLGLKRTKPWVVTREMELKEGSFFNWDQYTRDITAIWNTDFFADFSPNTLSPTPGVVDVTLNLQEKRTGNAAAGIGYSNRQRLVGRVDVSETNFLGRGQQINLLWETGGLANRNSVELGFTEPWLDRKHTSLSVSVYDRTVYRFGRRISSEGDDTAGSDTEYYETHTGGQVAVSRPINRILRGMVGLRYDHVRVPSLDLDADDAAILQNGPLADLTLRLTRNTRDFDTDPADGGLEILTVDIGQADLKPVLLESGETPNGVYGNVSFTKAMVDARRYISFKGKRQTPKDKRQTFALRVMVGMSTGTMPFSEQYFVGGAETLRGYYEDRFWGNNMVLGSVEYRTPLANALTGVVFADVGDAWGGPYKNVKFSGFEQHGNFNPKVGLGLGIRVVTPIGPIRIDQGFGSEGARTHFSIGHVF